MPFDDANPGREGGPPPGERRPTDESLMFEIRAAADSAVAQLRKVGATASTEARISVSSAIWMASAMMLIVALLISAWGCVVGIGVWFAIEAGWSVAAALSLAAAANILAALVCRAWYLRMLQNIGFSRTLSLLFGPVGRQHDQKHDEGS